MTLSIIIPAYNCGKTVMDTYKSIAVQSFLDYELIFVNDGSTDGTLAVLEDIASGDIRVKIITTENGGPANARNMGIKQAQGEYIAFVDSDDLLLPEMLLRMTQVAKENNSDVVCCGYQTEQPSGKKTYITPFLHEKCNTQTHEEFIRLLPSLIDAHVMYVVWNKLFKADFLRQNGFVFSNFLSGEDRLFNIQVFKQISRFSFVEEAFYRYRLLSKNSLANRFVEDRFSSVILCHVELCHVFSSMGMLDEKAKNSLVLAFVKGIMSCFTQFYSSSCPFNPRQRKQRMVEILANEQVTEITKEKGSGYYKLILSLLRRKKAGSILLLARFVHFMQVAMNPIYLKIKHRK